MITSDDVYAAVLKDFKTIWFRTNENDLLKGFERTAVLKQRKEGEKDLEFIEFRGETS